mmetsp:Transcript_25158/g.37386  ORF Transcript_25158/g.37386 Transcript_25158/m.37386 type:complete len:98 (-) Transcript_25158:990-1283(-)
MWYNSGFSCQSISPFPISFAYYTHYFNRCGSLCKIDTLGNKTLACFSLLPESAIKTCKCHEHFSGEEIPFNIDDASSTVVVVDDDAVVDDEDDDCDC